TDVLAAQRAMRERIRGVGFCLMVATMLHSIAVGNLLPAWVRVACVDINPATVTKLTDRGSIQTVGVVTDAEPFLRALVAELAAKGGAGRVSGASACATRPSPSCRACLRRGALPSARLGTASRPAPAPPRHRCRIRPGSAHAIQPGKASRPGQRPLRRR